MSSQMSLLQLQSSPQLKSALFAFCLVDRIVVMNAAAKVSIDATDVRILDSAIQRNKAAIVYYKQNGKTVNESFNKRLGNDSDHRTHFLCVPKCLD